MATLKLVSRLPQFAKKNQAELRSAMRAVAPIIKREILKNTSSAKGGHLHKSGDMRRSLQVIPVSGANPRIEVKVIDYGVYQDQGFTHYQSGEFIKNPFITPVIKGQRNDIMRFIANRLKKGK